MRKSAVNGIVSRDSVYVDEKKVYLSIDNSEPGYTDVSALLDDMYEDASGVASSEENQKRKIILIHIRMYIGEII